VKVVKPEIVKPKVIRIPVLPKTQPVEKRTAVKDPLSDAPIEKLQRLASEFTRIKDIAQAQGVSIPQNYSVFTDIRDSQSLQSNTDLLEQRIKQLTNQINMQNGQQATTDIPSVETGPSVEQPTVDTGGNMFDDPIVPFTAITDAIEIEQTLLASIRKDDDLSLEQKRDLAVKARNEVQELLDVNIDASTGDIQSIRNILNSINAEITVLDGRIKEEDRDGKTSLKRVTTAVKSIEIETQNAQDALDKLDFLPGVDRQKEKNVIKDSVERMVFDYNLIVEILNRLPFGVYKNEVKEYSVSMQQLVDYWVDISARVQGEADISDEPAGADEPAPEPEQPEEPVEPDEPEEPVEPAPSEEDSNPLSNLQSVMSNQSSTIQDVKREINKISTTVIPAGIKTKLRTLVEKKFTDEFLNIGPITKPAVKKYIEALTKLDGSPTNIDILERLNGMGDDTINTLNRKEYFVQTIYNMIAAPGQIILNSDGSYGGGMQNEITDRLATLDRFRTQLNDFKNNTTEFRNSGDRYRVINDEIENEISKITMLKNTSDVALVSQTLDDSFVKMDVGNLAAVIGALTLSDSYPLTKNDGLQLDLNTTSPTDPPSFLLSVTESRNNNRTRTRTEKLNSYGNLYNPNDAAPGESESETDLDSESTDETTTDESSDENERTEKIEKLLRSIFRTGRSDIQMGVIEQQTRLAENSDLNVDDLILSKYDPTVAIAALHVLGTTEAVKGKVIELVEESPEFLGGGAAPMYRIRIDGQFAVVGNGSEQYKFNQYGDIYTGADLENQPITLEFPFRRQD